MTSRLLLCLGMMVGVGCSEATEVCWEAQPARHYTGWLIAEAHGLGCYQIDAELHGVPCAAFDKDAHENWCSQGPGEWSAAASFARPDIPPIPDPIVNEWMPTEPRMHFVWKNVVVWNQGECQDTLINVGTQRDGDLYTIESLIVMGNEWRAFTEEEQTAFDLLMATYNAVRLPEIPSPMPRSLVVRHLDAPPPIPSPIAAQTDTEFWIIDAGLGDDVSCVLDAEPCDERCYVNYTDGRTRQCINGQWVEETP